MLWLKPCKFILYWLHQSPRLSSKQQFYNDKSWNVSIGQEIPSIAIKPDTFEDVVFANINKEVGVGMLNILS